LIVLPLMFGGMSFFRRLIFGFILMDRKGLPYHCVSAFFFSIGLICSITALIQLIEICGIPCWSPMDSANSITEKIPLSQGFSFIGIFILMAACTLLFSITFSRVEQKNRSYLDRIPIRIINKITIKIILLVFLSFFLMLVTGFVGMAVLK